MDSVKVSHISLSLQPVEVFSYLADLPWSIFLDSASPDHSDNRFSILAFEPKETVISRNGQTVVTNLNTLTSQTFHDDPLTILKQTIEQSFADVKATNKTPVDLGALGYFSYDLGQYFEKVPKRSTRDIDLPEMAQGIYHSVLVFDHENEQYSLIARESEFDDKLAFIMQHVQTPKARQGFTLSCEWQSNLTKKEYSQRFDKVQSYLHSGDCYQINLAQRFSNKYSGNEWLAYLALREANHAPFSAFIRLPDAAILSISPERFVSVTNGQVQTKPIKGTLPRDSDAILDKAAAEKLKHSEKDRAENLMIVDLLRNDLSKVSVPGTVNVPAIFEIESFPAVHHLVSTVTSTLDQKFHCTDLLRGAFPGGSITGAPKIRAMQIIEELEPHHRSVYCGAIGYIDRNGNMDTSITIRTLICKKGNIYCWAGGGVVVDSNCDAEYQETYDKVSRILPVLANLTDE